MAVKLLQYQTQNTCCKNIQVIIEDNKVVQSIFTGGCNGNLKAISNLIKNMEIEDIIEKLQGITCGNKNTSCADQLVKCLLQYKNELNEESFKNENN